MNGAPLHLVDTAGNYVRAWIQSAVEDAYRWTVRRFPSVDPALIANWAEQVAGSMEGVAGEIRNPARYATAALQGKVRDWLKTGAAKLEPIGIGQDLERLGGSNSAVQTLIERTLLFEQLKATLNDRDQVILVLLRDGSTDTEIATFLGITPPAGRKAIQRLKERISATLHASQSPRRSGHGSTSLCETKG